MPDNVQEALSKLKPIDLDFVRAYTDPNSPTYSNSTQSIISVRPGIDRTYARSAATRLKAKASVSDAIETLLAQNGADIQVRMRELAELVTKPTGRSVTKIAKMEDGSVETVVERSPSARDKIAAIDMVNKMTGLYKQHEVDAHEATKEIDRMYRRFAQRDKGAPREAVAPKRVSPQPTRKGRAMGRESASQRNVADVIDDNSDQSGSRRE